jgi:hypothetical protein
LQLAWATPAQEGPATQVRAAGFIPAQEVVLIQARVAALIRVQVEGLTPVLEAVRIRAPAEGPTQAQEVVLIQVRVAALIRAPVEGLTPALVGLAIPVRVARLATSGIAPLPFADDPSNSAGHPNPWCGLPVDHSVKRAVCMPNMPALR